ncbi:hypothetical protein UY3_11981 [Chelonia mydas]|uniref:Uncharacterized protein n=1 Tax=Chelonia mydas TaxID=8469 RepID=M7B1H7_CHEMY|nr:hypothetical protein UY3_11981 [Chelonia mydas]
MRPHYSLHNPSLAFGSDWAQLNCIQLNGAIHHGNRYKRCRKYSYANEMLPNILCSCKSHSRAWQLHHNAIQDRLVRAIPPPMGKFTVNSSIPGMDSQLNRMSEYCKNAELVNTTLVCYGNSRCCPLTTQWHPST